MRFAFILICIIVVCLPQQVRGQGEVGIFTGIANYQGDLASYSTENGLKVFVGPVLGVHGGYELSGRFQFRTDLLYLRIKGDDALSDNPFSRERNLDFFAPVIQLAVGMDWNILGFGAESQNVFTPYGSLGAGFFYFNPRTIYQGDKVSLQPLGTEGQFLEDYPDQEKYSRFQPSIQFGGGLKWKANPRLILAVEGMISYTFTDYLDDASTIYISYPELLEKAGPLPAALANRQGEYLGTDPVVIPTGTARANPDSKDLFGIFVLKASMPIEITIQKFKIRQHNNRKPIPNPKF